MASKLLNIRMDEEMLQELKKVCGELGINVTDAIKSFSKDLIENKKLPNENKKKDAEDTNEYREISGAEFIEIMEEMREVCGDIKGYEKMQEEISDIVLDYGRELRKFIDKNWSKYSKSYEDLAKNFKEIYSKEFNDKILDIIIDFYKRYYQNVLDEFLPIIEETRKYQQEKYIVTMEKLKEKNPQLYKELLDEYTLDIDHYQAEYLKTKGYLETEQKLKEILSPEELKEYVEYDNVSMNNEETSKYLNNIGKERKKILITAVNKVQERLEKEKLEKEQKEKIEK